MGRSKPEPVLRSALGARFTTTLLLGMLKPQARNAARTRSRDSCTEASAIPTTEKPGIPLLTHTSTSTGTACTPRNVAACTTHDALIATRPRRR